MPKHNPELASIYSALGLSSNHELSTLLLNIENTKRFSDLLHAVEREFFMVPGEPSDEPEDAGLPVDDECLVNRWGSTPTEYLRQFKAALSVAAANWIPAYEAPETGVKWSLTGDNGSWDYDKGLKTDWVRRQLERLERAGQVKRVPSVYARQICWALVEVVPT